MNLRDYCKFLQTWYSNLNWMMNMVLKWHTRQFTFFYLHCTQRNRRKLTTVLASRFMFHAKCYSVEHRKIHQRGKPLQLKSIAFYFNMNIHYDINLKVILAKFMEMRYLWHDGKCTHYVHFIKHFIASNANWVINILWRCQ